MLCTRDSFHTHLIKQNEWKFIFILFWRSSVYACFRESGVCACVRESDAYAAFVSLMYMRAFMSLSRNRHCLVCHRPCLVCIFCLPWRILKIFDNLFIITRRFVSCKTKNMSLKGQCNSKGPHIKSVLYLLFKLKNSEVIW